MKQLIVLCLFFQMITVSAFAQEYKYHIVEEGETVESVARKYNITKETIFKFNPDARRGIQPQSKLVVPLNQVAERDAEVEFKTHRVKRQETLWSLSQEYNVSIEDIKRYNKQLYSEELQRGDRIRIPVNLQKPPTEVPNEKFNTETSPTNPLDISAREHVVLPGEGKFRIAQTYNISVEELDRLNPGVDELKPGMILKVATRESRAATPPGERLFKYYQVKPQETIYTLTRELGISKDSLIGLNPALEDGLKAGMVLRIPNPEATVDLRYSSVGNYVNLEQRLTNFETRDLVVMLPFNLHNINSTDTTTNARERMRKDRVLQISLDFYSGVRMAIDSAKNLGLSTNVRFFDTEGNAAEVNNIINLHDFSNVDAVIGPIFQESAEAAADKLEGRGIPVISPLTKKETNRLDNFFQTRPTDEMLAEVMISYISENANGKNLIIIADGSAAERKRRLTSAFPNARVINPREGSYVSQQEVASALSKERPNWVILEGSSIGVLSNVTSYLNSISNAYNVTLFTTNKNNSFESDNISNRHLSKLRFHYPSVDKEFNRKMRNNFIEAYEEKYGARPNTYAVRGFDVTYDILLRLGTAENLMESIEEGLATEYVENKFSYEKRPTGGYLNRAIYIMAFGDDLELNVVR